MSDTSPVIVWFRRDLRTHDHPPLHAAAQTGRPVVALYIREHDVFPMGAASDWFLHYALKSLQGQLDVPLIIRRGAAAEIMADVARVTGADMVYHGRRYERDGREADERVAKALQAQGVAVETSNTMLASEPGMVKTDGGTPYKVFTPWYRKFREVVDVPEPLPAPDTLKRYTGNVESLSVDDLGLLPTKPDWGKKMEPYWDPGEPGALEALDEFMADPVRFYAEYRDRPDYDRTSRLSPFLAHGCISPRQCWQANEDADPGSDKFLSELGWREFSYELLSNYPDMRDRNINDKFDGFEWREGTDADRDFEAWTRGQTGYPFVDAGMRQLWETGWMHNRMRMITASFLIKHLLIDWRRGERWFWDCLCGGDPANNAQGWQWVAGSGVDASPFFRIFNPFTQGEKFDPKGDYTRKWVPELADLPTRHLQTPWKAPDNILADANVTLGETYPEPIVDHSFARERALAAYKDTK